MKLERVDAENFFEELFHGKHHFPSKLKPFGEGWSINIFGHMSTYDGNALTRLVFLAYDYGFRVEISPVDFQYFRIAIHRRESKEKPEVNWRDHPTLDTAVRNWKIEQGQEPTI